MSSLAQEKECKMDIQVQESTESFTAKISGKMLFEDRAKFNDLLAKMVSSAKSKFVIDLDNLESIDSAGLGMMMIAHDKISGEGKKFSIVNAKDQVKKVLEITDFGKIMHIEFAD